MNPLFYMSTPLSSIPVSSRYFSSQFGVVIWEVTKDGFVFPINGLALVRGPRSKLRLSDLVANSYTTELTPEAAAEMLGVRLEHDATGAYAPNIYDAALTPAYVPAHGRVVTMRVMADRFFNENFEVGQNHFFSMS